MIPKRKFLPVALLGAILSSIAVTAAPATWPEPVFPGRDWERARDVSAYGLTQEDIASWRRGIEALDTTSAVVAVGGRILFSHGDPAEQSYVASVRKSILAMMYGQHVENGTVRLDETIGEIGITDVLGLLDIEKRATVHDLLRARSGVYHQPSNTGDNVAHAPARGSQEPGTYYLYNNWDFNALGTIFTTKTGLSPYEALERQLAIPLGMQDFSQRVQRWGGDPSLSEHRAYHFTLSTRDMARIAHLMLRNGEWDGQRLISETWMRRMMHPWTPSADMNPQSRRDQGHSYGYLWWLQEKPEGDPYHGAFAGHGYRGQYIFIVPSVDLVIAHKTDFRRERGRRVRMVQFYPWADTVVQSLYRVRPAGLPLAPIEPMRADDPGPR